MTKGKKTTIIAAVLILLVLGIALAIQQYYRLKISNIQSRDAESHLLYVYPDATLG